MHVLKNAASLLISLLLFILVVTTQSQANTIYGSDWSGNDLVPNNGDILTGIFTNVGSFKILDGLMVTATQGLTMQGASLYVSGTLTIDSYIAALDFTTIDISSTGNINVVSGGLLYLGSGEVPIPPALLPLPNTPPIHTGGAIVISVNDGNNDSLITGIRGGTLIPGNIVGTSGGTVYFQDGGDISITGSEEDGGIIIGQSPTSVPEPSTIILVSAALGVLITWRKFARVSG